MQVWRSVANPKYGRMSSSALCLLQLQWGSSAASQSPHDLLSVLLPLIPLSFPFWPVGWLHMYCLRCLSTHRIRSQEQFCSCYLKRGESFISASSSSTVKQSQSGVRRPLCRLLFRACCCWRRTCTRLDGSPGFIFSEESDLFLQFVLLPLSKMIEGRHGHAKDSVEVLWWEVTLGGERRRRHLETSLSVSEF